MTSHQFVNSYRLFGGACCLHFQVFQEEYYSLASVVDSLQYRFGAEGSFGRLCMPSVS